MYKIWLIIAAVVALIENWLGSRLCLGFISVFFFKESHFVEGGTTKLQMGRVPYPRSHDGCMARLGFLLVFAPEALQR